MSPHGVLRGAVLGPWCEHGDPAHALSVGVSPLAGCQWALLELQVKEQSLSGHTHCWGGLLWVEGDLAPVSWE